MSTSLLQRLERPIFRSILANVRTCIDSYLDQTDSQPTVPASVPFSSPNCCKAPKHAFVLGNIGVDVSRPSRALDLQSLSHQVKREHRGFREDAGKDAGSSISRAKWECLATNILMQKLIAHEEKTHIRHNLPDRRAQASEEPRWAFMMGDVAYGAKQSLINPL